MSPKKKERAPDWEFADTVRADDPQRSMDRLETLTRKVVDEPKESVEESGKSEPT